jgi:hypothetical protein
MKPLMIVGLAAILAVAAFAASSSESMAGVEPSPFHGAWESRDLDGSYQRLMIGGPWPRWRPVPITYHIVYFDHGATVCGGDQALAIGVSLPIDPSTPNTLEVGVPWCGHCLKSHTAFDGQTLTLIFNPGEEAHRRDDTLMQETAGGVIFWKRQGANVGPPHTSPE